MCKNGLNFLSDLKETNLNLPPPPSAGYFYQFSLYKIHQHSGDEINFTPMTRVNVCCTFDIQNGKPDRSSESYFTKSVVGTKFP